MRSGLTSFLGGLILFAAGQLALAQSGSLGLPKTVEAGAAFSIHTAGSGKGVLYIVGPGQVLRRDVQLGEAVSFRSRRYAQRRPLFGEFLPAARPRRMARSMSPLYINRLL